MIKAKKCGEWMMVIFLLGLIILCIRAILIINFQGFPRYCDTDMYSDTLVAKLMWEQKTLFPQNWVFGNQFYVIATPVLCALFYGVTGNLNFSMGLASTVMGLLILVSFAWMLSPFVKKKRHLLVGTAAFLCCVLWSNIQYNTFGQLFFIMCSYYSCYLITAFITWGIYARLLLDKDCSWRRKKPFIIACGVCAALAFATGIQSIRQTVIMIVPLCILEFGRWIFRRRTAGQVYDRKPLFLTVAVTGFNLAGLLAIRMAGVQHYEIFGDMSLVKSLGELKENLTEVYSAICSVTGFFLQDNIWMTAIDLLMIFLFAAAVVRAIKNRKKREGLALFILLFAVSLLVVICGSVFLNVELRPAYLCFWYPMVCAAVVYILENSHGLDYALYAVLFCLLAGKSYFLSYVPMLETIEYVQDEYAERLEIVDWMEQTGYDIVYGRWNSAEGIAAASNGTIQCGCWEFNTPEGILEITPWLMKTDLYSEECNAHAVYLVHNDMAEEFIKKAGQMGAEVQLVWQMDTNYYSLYTSTMQLMRPRQAENGG